MTLNVRPMPQRHSVSDELALRDGLSFFKKKKKVLPKDIYTESGSQGGGPIKSVFSCR